MIHTHIAGVNIGSFSYTKRIDVSADEEINLDLAIAGNATNYARDLDLDVSDLKSFVLLATGGDLTVKTNSSGAPANTIALVDGIPFAWREGAGVLRDTADAAIATDITQIFITNAGAGEVKLRVWSLIVPTP